MRMKKISGANAVFAIGSIAFAISYGNGKVGAGSISNLIQHAGNLMSMAVNAPDPEISTVQTTTNLVNGAWRNVAYSTSSEGLFATGALPGMNSMIYVQATNPAGFFAVGQILGDIYYTTTANWSSQTVSDTNGVVIHNNATVTLDQSDSAGTLRLGSQTGAGTLLVNSPFNLTLTNLTVNTNGLLHVAGGSVTAAELTIDGPGGEVSLTGGSLYAKMIGGSGTVTIDGGTLRDSAGSTVPAALLDRFSAPDQTVWATTDAQIAVQIGSNWKRGNIADQVSQYRLVDNQVDIGAASSTDQKAMLINTAAETVNAGVGTGFRLSATLRQDHTASSGFMGLVFNYQTGGSYYLFRVNGVGTVQMLSYMNNTQQAVPLNTGTPAFTAVQNRSYIFTVTSTDPYTFDLEIMDTVNSSIVYSKHITLATSVVKLQDGLGGMYTTSDSAAFDDFHMEAVPNAASVTCSGGLEIQSGQVSLNGGTVNPVALNTSLFDVSGGNVSLGQVSQGGGLAAKFSVTGDAAKVDMVSLNEDSSGAVPGTFRFVFDTTGISPVQVASRMDLSATKLIVDGSAYTGGVGHFTLFDSSSLIAPPADSNITVTGFGTAYEARIEQDQKQIRLVYDVPKLFTDVTVARGLGAMANKDWACWFDLNHDEWIDLAAGQHVWVNNGGTNFTDLRWVGNVVAADFDNDGWVDLFSHSNRLLFRNNHGTLVNFPLPVFPVPYSCQAACWGDFNNDGWVDLYVSGFETPAANYPNLLLINNSGQSFTMSTLGSSDTSRGVTACDFDQDNDLDIYVSNYRLQPNQLWRNNGSAVFANKASEYNVLSTERSWPGAHSIGNCWADFDNDGLFDLFSGNFSHRGSSWGRDGIQPESDFFRNRGAANHYYFEDKGTCGIYWQESWAVPAAGDYDNDGRVDLFFTTVYSGDYPALFRNVSDFVFTKVEDPPLTGLPETYQAAWADYNNDGNLDLMTAGKLFQNNGANSNNWLKVHLTGDGIAVNRSAVGAQVRITLGAKTLTRQVEAGTGQGNQNDLTLHFGLGQQTAPVNVNIIWPGGTMQTVSNVSPNQLISVTFNN